MQGYMLHAVCIAGACMYSGKVLCIVGNLLHKYAALPECNAVTLVWIFNTLLRHQKERKGIMWWKSILCGTEALRLLDVCCDIYIGVTYCGGKEWQSL